MKEPRCFFQDFLFEDLPVDEQDYPMVEIRELINGEDANNYSVVSFDTMLRMNKREEWDSLFSRLLDANVCIQDDVKVLNPEMDYYKDFYLRTYYHVLSKHCKSVCVQY